MHTLDQNEGRDQAIGLSSQEYFPQPRIIIIGAGAAGIAAATRLLKNNITNLIILEAESRVGGRIYTTKFENSIVDLGVQFSHNNDTSMVYEIGHLHLLGSNPGHTPYMPYHSSRKELDPVFFNEQCNMFDKMFYDEENTCKDSFGEHMLERTRQIVREKFGGDVELQSTFIEALNSYILELIANEGPFSWHDGTEEIYNDDDIESWEGSDFETIIDIFKKKYLDPLVELSIDAKIDLNKEVTKVYWQGNAITVCCGEEFYTADHVIFTPSLGVLKHQCHTLFEPRLPAEKIQAITTIGMGSIVRMHYYFPVVWWPHNSHNFTFVWSDEDRDQVANEFPDAVLTNGKSWLLSVFQLIRIANAPNLLGAWICGETAPEVESLSDERIINGTMFILNKFLGHVFPNIIRPSKLLRENWYANNHFRGAHSYQTKNSRDIPGDSQQRILSKPLLSRNGIPRLFFAGEATAVTDYGTVHGAIKSGWREADRIFKIYGWSSQLYAALTKRLG